MSETRSPTANEIHDRNRAAAAADVRVGGPAKVVRYDASKRLCDVQMLVKETHADEDGTPVLEALPRLWNVPVMFPSCKGFTMSFPLAVGDTVLVLFCDTSLDVWLTTGGLVDPKDGRRHSINDAVALPGLFDFAHAPAGSASGIEIGAVGGPFVGVAVGGTNYDAYVTALQTHTHPAIPVGGGPVLASLDLASLTLPASSATVKVTP